MKHLYVLILVAACGGGGKPAAEPATSESSGATATESTAEVAPVDAAPPAPDAMVVNTGLPECDAYIQRVERYLACDKLTPEERDASRAALEKRVAEWKDLQDRPAKEQKKLVKACQNAEGALEKASAERGCAI